MIQLEMSKADYAPIQELPNEILGKIVKRMIPVNQYELSTALRTIKHFGQVSKRMHAVVCSNYIRALVIYSVLKKHDGLPKYLLKRLDLFSLGKYIRKRGLDKAFKMVSKIQDIILKSLQPVNAILRAEVGARVSLDVNYTWRSRDFLVLFAPHSSKQTVEVIHPFGQMVLSFKSSGQSDDANMRITAMIAEAVIHGLNASFQGIFDMRFSMSWYAFQLIELRSSCRRVAIVRHHNQLRQISRGDVELMSWRDVEAEKGGQQIIFARNFFTFSCYKIHQVSGEKLPHIRCRDSRLMHVISEMLRFASSLNANSSALDECLGEERMKTHLEGVIANVLEDTFLMDPLLHWDKGEEVDRSSTGGRELVVNEKRCHPFLGNAFGSLSQ